MLAIDVNDNAYCLRWRGVFESFASKLAPAVIGSGSTLAHQVLEPLEHQHHHRQPDRDVGQPFTRPDAFPQQQRHPSNSTGST